MSEPQVAALSTPHLNNSEAFPRSESQTPVIRKEDAAEGDISFSSGKVVSVFDMAAEIESKLKSVSEKIEKQDLQIATCVDSLSNTLADLESKLQPPSDSQDS